MKSKSKNKDKSKKRDSKKEIGLFVEELERKTAIVKDTFILSKNTSFLGKEMKSFSMSCGCNILVSDEEFESYSLEEKLECKVCRGVVIDKRKDSSDLKELSELCKPIREWLFNNSYNNHVVQISEKLLRIVKIEAEVEC